MPTLAIVLTMMISLLTGAALAADGRGGGFGTAPRDGNAGGQRSGDFGVHGFGGARGESGSHGFGAIGTPNRAIAPHPNYREWHGGERHFEEPHHHHIRPGFFIESPYAQPNFYYWPYYNQPYYSAPTVIVPSSPPAYIEQQTIPSIQPTAPDSWSYCPGASSYYPYVQDCPGGWLEIEPQPRGQPPGYWYYCSDPPGYYPYVRECGTVWQNIVP